MMYPFLTLDDETEITHSEYLSSGRVKVYVEKADEKDCFHYMTCYLPDYTVENIFKANFSTSFAQVFRFQRTSFKHFNKPDFFKILSTEGS